MGLQLSAAAASDPIDVAAAKAHLRVSHTAEDALITSLISAATRHAQAFTGRQLVTATWIYTLPRFPACRRAIELPLPPLQSVSSITYIDAAGDEQTLATDQYQVETAGVVGQIHPAYGVDWPLTRYGLPDQVSITFVAGYGDAGDVPEDIVAAIKLLVGHWYENRESVVIGTIATQLPVAADALLWMHRVVGVS